MKNKKGERGSVCVNHDDFAVMRTWGKNISLFHCYFLVCHIPEGMRNTPGR